MKRWISDELRHHRFGLNTFFGLKQVSGMLLRPLILLKSKGNNRKLFKNKIKKNLFLNVSISRKMGEIDHTWANSILFHF